MALTMPIFHMISWGIIEPMHIHCSTRRALNGCAAAEADVRSRDVEAGDLAAALSKAQAQLRECQQALQQVPPPVGLAFISRVVGIPAVFWGRMLYPTANWILLKGGRRWLTNGDLPQAALVVWGRTPSTVPGGSAPKPCRPCVCNQ